MKTKRLWINFISHKEKRKWRWKPNFSKAQIVYGSGGKAYLSPIYEFSWLFLVFQWTSYSIKKEYKSDYETHECDRDLLQERMIELESAIRKHRNTVGEGLSMHVDRQLWSVLRD